MSIKPILFIDFDGTLCHDRFWRSLGQDSLRKIQDALFSSNKDLIRDWMRGMYTSEEINRRLVDILGLSYDSLWRNFVDDCKSMSVDGNVLKKIRELKAFYKIILITDNMDSFDRFTVPGLGLKDYFDDIINSFNMKKLKTESDGQVFIDTLKRNNILPQQAILFDDSEKSCETFNKLGGRSFRVAKERPLLHCLNELK
ncbi:MAG TPA: HAD family hydrolase [Candidatus Paceibacterota bacterium]|jgi:FMN phosphatase YigB (HAD superfamily)|nr:HAD family hydrolase [Candidatus Paceibacterota bacterium]